MEDFVCENPFQADMTSAEKRECAKDKLVSQMRKFTGHESPSGRTIIYSGKLGPDGKKVEGQNDDLMMAFILGVYMLDLFTDRKIPFFDWSILNR